MKVTIYKRVEIEAAHSLPNYIGKCANLHGHRWEVTVGVSGPVDPKTGMVLDFKALSKILQEPVEQLDHHLVNDTIHNPTAENMSLYIGTRVKEGLRLLPEYGKYKLESVEVKETADNWVKLED